MSGVLRTERDRLGLGPEPTRRCGRCGRVDEIREFPPLSPVCYLCSEAVAKRRGRVPVR